MERKGEWINESEGGRKVPYVSKNEAKYKVKEIKLWQEIATAAL